MERCADCSVLVALAGSGEPIGTLILLQRPNGRAFQSDEIRACPHVRGSGIPRLSQDPPAGRVGAAAPEIEQITESRARLVRGFSHDLKNPLGAADGHAALLDDGILGPLEPRQQQSVARIRASIRSALALIEDLLEHARAEAGQIHVENAPMDVREVAETIAGEYRAQVETADLTPGNGLPHQFLWSAPTRAECGKSWGT